MNGWKEAQTENYGTEAQQQTEEERVAEKNQRKQCEQREKEVRSQRFPNSQQSLPLRKSQREREEKQKQSRIKNQQSKKEWPSYASLLLEHRYASSQM